jgi:hypothetical protein
MFFFVKKKIVGKLIYVFLPTSFPTGTGRTTPDLTGLAENFTVYERICNDGLELGLYSKGLPKRD